MSEFKPRRCRNCGEGTILPRSKPGRKERYRNLMLEVPKDFQIPTCDKCGAEWINESVAEQLDARLAGQFRDELRKRVNAAIEAITGTISQRRLEMIMGVSEGYISKVKRGEREPSPELVAELALLARDPRARARELENFWGIAESDEA